MMKKVSRPAVVGVGLVAIALAGSAVVGAGCSNEGESCGRLRTCNAGATGSGGTGGTTPTACVPSESPDAVGDECGVFVSSSGGMDTNTGTTAAPMKTLDAAIALAQQSGVRVYACAETFEEAIEVPGGATIYGGLDCANGWGWIGDTTQTTVTTTPGEIPVRMHGGQGSVHIEDVHAIAPSLDASDTTQRGKSAIAAMAEGIDVELVRSTLEAGDAAPGVDSPSFAMSAPNGEVGNAGSDACTASQVLGGDEKLNDCGTPMDPSDDSIGGSGGTGQQSTGANGSPGSPGSAINFGSGETATACTSGTAGDVGASGVAGSGAAGLGSISSTGYTGVPGMDGGKGAPGQGGGGGGGSKGGTGANQCTAGSAGGASGGSGGSGGCGGLGGKGGGPGGASIALISINASMTFDGVTLKAGRGGPGGAGGQGQNGGTPGGGGSGGAVPMSSGLNPGCSGGPGGPGGAGGRGGGGLGGHSFGIAFQGTPPPTGGVSIETGEAGSGGVGQDLQHNGAAGLKTDVQEMP